MPSSDRGIVAALAGCLVLASLGLWDHHQQQKPAISCESGAATDNCRPEQYATERAGITSTFERAISNPEPRTGQDHEKRDLAAQEASAVFAFWMVLISGFGAVVTTLATVLLYQQIRLTREAVEDTGQATQAMLNANKIAKDSAIRQLRAYVSVSDISLGVGMMLKMSLHTARVTLKNSGTTPAKMRRIEAQGIWTGEDGSKEVFKIDSVMVFEVSAQQSVIHVIPTTKDLEKLEGDGQLLVKGKVTYLDVFKKMRECRFAYMSDPDFTDEYGDDWVELQACHMGNDSD